MNFTRYEIHVTPRALTPAEQAKWPRKDGSKRECLLVYDLQTGKEIGKDGETVTVISREHQATYARQERHGDISVGMPPAPQRRTPKTQED